MAESRWPSQDALVGPMRAYQRMQMRATGLDDDALSRPFVGVVHTQSDAVPCAMALEPQAGAVRIGVEVAGATPREFRTVSISDMWTIVHERGPQFSLISREVVADSAELVLRGQKLDAVVAIGSCDKTVPGLMMAMTRVNLPGVYVHGGAAIAGWRDGKPINLYELGLHMERAAAGEISEEELDRLSRDIIVTGGTCLGMNTASTAATCAEIMGFAALGTTTLPAVYTERLVHARRAGARAVSLLLDDGPRPRDWVTRESLENAVTAVAATRGSSNMLLHLPAIANEAGVPFELKDMTAILRRTPRITSLIPNGTNVALDLHRVGGLPTVFRSLLEGGFLHPDVPTNDGRSLAEALANAPEPDGVIVRGCDDPFQTDSGVAVLQGNLARSGCIVKTAGIPALTFEGPARVFDGDAAARQGLTAGEFSAGDVIIVRGEGPRGTPGMREMFDVTVPIRRRGLGDQVALVTDGRWPSATGGLCVSHVSPEAHTGGPLAQVRDGDIVRIDATSGAIDLHVSDEEVTRRRSEWIQPGDWVGGLGEKYARLVGPSHLGAPTHSFQ